MDKKINKKGVCIITFSDNYDHQEVAFSMFNALYPEYNVYNIGLINQKNPRSPQTDRSFYYDAPKRPGFTKGTFNFKLVRQIVKKINSLDIEYVYFESEHIWNAFVMRKLRKDIKKVVVIHDVIPHSDSKGKALANKVTCKMADYVVIRNDKYVDELIRRYNVKKENVIVMPLWRYYPEFQESNNNDRNFLFFGRIRKYKGLDALTKIIVNCPEVQFKLVGAPNEESKADLEIIRSFNNVEITDREVSDDEMNDFFKNTTCVILPYSNATQSGVIVDAYKLSKPVIAFNVGAICEQVENGISGYLIENNNIDEFAKIIKEINDMNDESLKSLQQRAYDYGYKKYSAQKNKEIFIKYFLS
ncbi:MAG: glycosyltransferase family 4 protein [Bacilli bacterium]